MNKTFSFLILALAIVVAGSLAYTQEVDLSDVDTDQPVDSPSLDNPTPAGSAPGEPIESPYPGTVDYDDLSDTVVV
jgi:hypothetical protein